MTSFSDLNGVPASANEFLLRQVLRDEWGYEGFVVSDWDSISQLAVHGLTADDRESAFEAANAGVDMEMASRTYADHLAALVADGRISPEQIDAMAGNVLRVKLRLGLFDNPYTDPAAFPGIAIPAHLDLACEAARQSAVLLKNDDGVLPLSPPDLRSLAVIGPLADHPSEQLGTWVFDGDPRYSRTILPAIREAAGPSVTVQFAPGLDTTRTRSRDGFRAAIELAQASDAVVLVLGEEAILSGEAHSRAEISLPGAQEDLIREIAAVGKPVILVLMAGRPIALERVVGSVHAILCVWHPGTMAGPAIADLLFGAEAPSGKLPVTFPRVTGQIPIYYAHKNTGKPATPETVIHIDDIDPGAPQHSVGNVSFHLDAGYTPLFPFGHGLSYTRFAYRDIEAAPSTVRPGETVTIRAEVTNEGERAAVEVVQLYVRDLVGSVTRPVRELKAFRRIRLAPGERRTVAFELHTDDLAFTGRRMQRVTEPGRFHAWIGGSSAADLRTEFTIVAP
jgi:beta-glucosidase